MAEPDPKGKRLSPAMRVLSAFAVALIAAAVVWQTVELFSALSSGETRWRRGRGIIRVATSPLSYWGVIACQVFAIIGTAWFVVVGIKETVSGRTVITLGK